MLSEALQKANPYLYEEVIQGTSLYSCYGVRNASLPEGAIAVSCAQANKMKPKPDNEEYSSFTDIEEN